MDRMMFRAEDATDHPLTAEYGPDFGGPGMEMGWRLLPPPHEFELSYLFSFF
jgi:hypothetical protein